MTNPAVEEAEHTEPGRRSRVWMVFLNLAVAGVCAVSVLTYFWTAFAAGERPGPVPIEVKLLLGSVLSTVAALGIVLGACARSFPWVVVMETPLLSALTMCLLSNAGDGASLTLVGLLLGCVSSAVFLFFASAAWTIKRWVRKRKAIEQR